MVFNKMKQWLGIEGTKIAIELPDFISKSKGEVSGTLHFSTLNTQQVLGVKLRLYEVYTQGRRKNKRTSEYKLGEIFIDQSFMVYPEDSKSMQFTLPFKLVKSEMDKLQERGGLKGGLASLAKKTRGVHSTYRIEAEAVVAGTKLNPFAKKEVDFVR